MKPMSAEEWKSSWFAEALVNDGADPSDVARILESLSQREQLLAAAKAVIDDETTYHFEKLKEVVARCTGE